MKTIDVIGFGVGDPTWLYAFLIMGGVAIAGVVVAKLVFRKKL